MGPDWPLFLELAQPVTPFVAVGRGIGQRGSVGSETEPASYVGLGCLEEFVEEVRGFWWGTGGQAQVAENLGDHGGLLNGGEDGQGAAALGTGGEVNGEDACE